MYEKHFGLRTAPFGLTPDTAFFFDRASGQDALNMLLVALRSGEGFLKVTGEIGLGKTTLCRMLLRSLGEGFTLAYVPNPTASRAALISLIADELGCRPRASSTGVAPVPEPEMLLRAIERKLIKIAQSGNRTVLILDEAQALPDEVLETVRLLTNLETEQDKLLQVVLFGQPELDARLARPELRQLRSRITFSHHLAPLDREQFGAYLRHRVEVAGGSATLFDREAVDVLWRGSRGVPRIANILGHKALLSAFGPGAAGVGVRDARAAVLDTDGTARTPSFWPAPWPWPTVLADRPALLIPTLIVAGLLIAVLLAVTLAH